MRKIEFRGVDKLTGKWVYGAYLKHQEYMPYPIGAGYQKEEDYIHLILESGFADWGMKRGIDCHVVKQETVGQYTGLKDKNGKKIFEGDFLEYETTGSVRQVSYKNGSFVLSHENSNVYLLYDLTIEDGVTVIDWEVIGNIYEKENL